MPRREGSEGEQTRHLRVGDGDSLAGEVSLAGRQGNGEEQLAVLYHTVPYSSLLIVIYVCNPKKMQSFCGAALSASFAMPVDMKNFL